MIVRAGGVVGSEKALVADTDALSVTRMVKLADPTVVGVPDITPCARLSPAGSDPLATDHVYGGVPPDALSPCEYAVPTVPGGNEEVVMLRTGALIASDRAALADADMLSTTLSVKLDEPAATGVPLIIPSASFSPAGSDPLATDHVYGGVPPVTLIACEYPVPAVPAGNEDVVMFNAGALIVSNSGALADDDALSVTLTVMLEEPGVVGVPEIVLPASPSPAGSDPLEIDHVYGGSPPVALSACE